MKTPQNPSHRGRRLALESRATEFRQRLTAWKLNSDSSRPSLRALARELGTSHQLLSFYLKHFEQWQGKEYWRKAREIRATANAERRPQTQWEDRQARGFERAAIRATAGYNLRDVIDRMKKDSERRPLVWQEIKALKLFSRQFPEARELLQSCSHESRKQRKLFAVIVKETPRQKGETYVTWVRRIWDECDKYETKCPTIISEELLQNLSQHRAKDQKEDLPVTSSAGPKSFKWASRCLATPLNPGAWRETPCRRTDPQCEISQKRVRGGVRLGPGAVARSRA
jgi:hypothetical protein